MLRPARAARPLAWAGVGVVTADPVLTSVVVEFLFLKSANDASSFNINIDMKVLPAACERVIY